MPKKQTKTAKNNTLDVAKKRRLGSAFYVLLSIIIIAVIVYLIASYLFSFFATEREIQRQQAVIGYQ